MNVTEKIQDIIDQLKSEPMSKRQESMVQLLNIVKWLSTQFIKGE